MQANPHRAARLLVGLLSVSSARCGRPDVSPQTAPEPATQQPQPAPTAPNAPTQTEPRPVATTAATHEISYRATGTEPFWGVSITPSTLRVAWPEPEPTLTTSYTVEEVADQRVYRSPTLTLTVTAKRCSDGMSERVYPDTVELKVAERVLRGCGWPSGYDLGPPP